MQKNLKLTLTGIVLACAGLVVICVYQTSTIIGKKIRLSETQNALAVVEQELAAAREIFDEVSSDAHHELYARKRGYGVSGERGYFAR